MPDVVHEAVIQATPLEFMLAQSSDFPAAGLALVLAPTSVVPGLATSYAAASATAPAVQEESDFLRSVRVQPCIRPLNAAVWLLALM
jgi:hypothetical protein